VAPTPRPRRSDLPEGQPDIRRAPSIRRAKAADLPALEKLLSLCQLPVDGVAEQLGAFLLTWDGQHLAGSVGIERYGVDGLLRSLAVHPDHRGRGLGATLTRRALTQARRVGLRRLFLLTETAAEYFPRFGFEVIPRQQAPPAVQASVEFASACPVTASCMERSLA
jgi:amino-acid N-acetyltransferase